MLQFFFTVVVFNSNSFFPRCLFFLNRIFLFLDRSNQSFEETGKSWGEVSVLFIQGGWVFQVLTMQCFSMSLRDLHMKLPNAPPISRIHLLPCIFYLQANYCRVYCSSQRFLQGTDQVSGVLYLGGLMQFALGFLIMTSHAIILFPFPCHQNLKGLTE